MAGAGQMKPTSSRPFAAFDPAKFPNIIGLDSSALILAFEKTMDPDAERTKELIRLFAKERVKMIVPALVFAEVLRKNAQLEKLPLAKGVIVTPFDNAAAIHLAAMKPTRPTARCECRPSDYWKMDAAIAACAQRWGVQQILGRDLKAKATRYGDGLLKMVWLDAFESSQTEFGL